MTETVAEEIGDRLLVLPADKEPSDCVFDEDRWIEGRPVEVRR